MIYAYIRVSTDKQTTENQRYEIERYCNKEEWVVDEWIDEVISGTKSAEYFIFHCYRIENFIFYRAYLVLFKLIVVFY